MTKTRGEKRGPAGLLRALLHAPIWLYKAHLGFLLGSRFLMLTHVGRKSRLRRFTVVEVVEHDPATDTYFIASGWGKRADWYQNLLQTPHVTVHVGTRRFETDAVHLSSEQAEQTLARYAARNPFAFSKLYKFMRGEGLPEGGASEGARKLAEHVPLVALTAS